MTAAHSSKAAPRRRIASLIALALLLGTFLGPLVTPVFAAESLGPWTPTSIFASTPGIAGGESCAVDYSNVFCVGGNTVFQGTYASGTPISGVYSAPLSSAGIGTWSATTSYPIAVSLLSCVIDDGYIYCVGGSPGPYYASTSAVYSAPITGGSVGAWTPTTSYPAAVQGESCVTDQGYIFCVGGSTGTSAYYASLSAGAVGTWTATTPYPVGVFGPSCMAEPGYVYCVAGSGAGNSVYYATLGSAGVGTWNATTGYPWMDSFGQTCTASSGYAYCVGGCVTPQPGCFTGEVYYAPLSANGVGEWSATTSYPDAYYDNCWFSSEYIYCITGSGAAYYAESTDFTPVLNSISAAVTTLEASIASAQSAIDSTISTAVSTIETSITSAQTAITTSISDAQSAILSAISSAQTAIVNAIVAHSSSLVVQASPPPASKSLTSSVTIFVQVNREDNGVGITGATVSCTLVGSTTAGTWASGTATSLGGGTYSVVVTPSHIHAGTAEFRIDTAITISGVAYAGSTLVTVTVT